MWIFAKEGKSWTCPDSSLVQFARIQASDNDELIKDGILNNDIAKAYLISKGFEVSRVEDDPPLTEVPKVANWYDRNACGLDGDRC